MTTSSRSRQNANYYFVIVLLTLSLFLFGCQGKDTLDNVDSPTTEETSNNQSLPDEPAQETTDPEAVNQSPSPDLNAIDDEQLRELKVNELGDVMVLMYHIIGDKEDEWERTKDNFRNDLKILYDEGYYLVTARDFVTGNMDVPAGKTPVILTFDDATEGHFRFLEQDNGELTVDPDCAVGIIENFTKEHPDFGIAASFYVYYPVPFRQNDRPEWRQLKYDYIVNLGMEIGNHTYGHDFLNKLTDEQVQETLVKNILATQKFLPGYSVDTFALSYGIYPKNKQLAATGTFDGTSYNHAGVFLVGSNPSPSPYSTSFNPLGIPRIRAASVPEDYFNQWIQHFKDKPEKRYISDGDPETVTIPKTLAETISQERLQNKTLRVYDAN